MRRFIFAIVSAVLATTAIASTAAARDPHPRRTQPVRHERWESPSIEHRRPAARPLPARRPLVPIGAKIDIQWGASWWAGTVLAARDGVYLVHYDGWSSSWDEWVGIERIRPPFAVQYVEPELQPVYWNYAPQRTY